MSRPDPTLAIRNHEDDMSAFIQQPLPIQPVSAYNAFQPIFPAPAHLNADERARR